MAVSFSTSGFEGSASGDEDNTQLSVLADAIKKMDGLIGDFRSAFATIFICSIIIIMYFRPPSPDLPVPVLSSDPTLLAIIGHSEQLAQLIAELKQVDTADHSRPHLRECVPASVQEVIISWLGGINLVRTRTT